MSILNIRDAEPDLFSDYLYFNPDVYSQYDPCIREFNLDKAWIGTGFPEWVWPSIERPH